MDPIRFQRTTLRLLEPMEDGSLLRGGDGSGFGDLLKRAIDDAADLQDEAGQLIRAFVQGEPVEIHDVMAAAEEAGVALELLVEVRNKLMEAYRTIMNVH